MRRAQTFGDGDRSRAFPVLTKYSGNPVFTNAQSAFPTILWPSVLNVSEMIANPMDAYYMWYSTDHELSAYGIGLATAPAPTGPWTDYGLVYRDEVQGVETETPSVLWTGTEFFMYYQQAAAGWNQSTLLAKSPDGVTWTRFGVVLDVANTTDQPGDGHTGYFTPFYIGGRIVGYSLVGGGDYSRGGMWFSNDGEVFTRDPRALGYAADFAAQLGGRRPSWHHSQVILWQGRLLWIGRVVLPVSGATTADAFLAVAPISDDLRTFTAPPRPLLTASDAWESADLRAWSLLADGGRLYIYYQMGNKFGVAFEEI